MKAQPQTIDEDTGVSSQRTTASVIQEFGLSITAVGDNQYWVRTEKVAKGVQLAEEKMEWPVAF